MEKNLAVRTASSSQSQSPKELEEDPKKEILLEPLEIFFRDFGDTAAALLMPYLSTIDLARLGKVSTTVHAHIDLAALERSASLHRAKLEDCQSHELDWSKAEPDDINKPALSLLRRELTLARATPGSVTAQCSQRETDPGIEGQSYSACYDAYGRQTVANKDQVNVAARTEEFLELVSPDIDWELEVNTRHSGGYASCASLVTRPLAWLAKNPETNELGLLKQAPDDKEPSLIKTSLILPEQYDFATVSPNGRFILYAHPLDKKEALELYDCRTQESLQTRIGLNKPSDVMASVCDNGLICLRDGDRYLTLERASSDSGPVLTFRSKQHHAATSGTPTGQLYPTAHGDLVIKVRDNTTLIVETHGKEIALKIPDTPKGIAVSPLRHLAAIVTWNEIFVFSLAAATTSNAAPTAAAVAAIPTAPVIFRQPLPADDQRRMKWVWGISFTPRADELVVLGSSEGQRLNELTVRLMLPETVRRLLAH